MKIEPEEITVKKLTEGFADNSELGAGATASEVMDVRQAAAYLGVSMDSMYNYASEGFIPAFRLGNRWRFRKCLLDAWMTEQSSTRVQDGGG